MYIENILKITRLINKFPRSSDTGVEVRVNKEALYNQLKAHFVRDEILYAVTAFHECVHTPRNVSSIPIEKFLTRLLSKFLNCEIIFAFFRGVSLLPVRSTLALFVIYRMCRNI